MAEWFADIYEIDFLPYYHQLSEHLLCLVDEHLQSNCWPLNPDEHLRREEAVLVAVCRTTPMTLKRWARMSQAERQPWIKEAIRVLSQSEPAPGPPAAVDPKPDAASPLVTLAQMSGMVRQSKKTLTRWKNDEDSTLPEPDIEGGGGKPDLWRWDRVRSCLEARFGCVLPEQFPV
jgi:hypothetical protein